MNGLVFAVAVNLVVLVGSEDIDFDTILNLIKPKRRSNTDSVADSIETIPVVPGFYWQKPKELSSSLFKNPAPWPDFRYKNATKEDTSYPTKIQDSASKDRIITSKDRISTSKDRISTSKDRISTPKDDYLTQKILKAVENLNRYKESQKSFKTKKDDSNVKLGKLLKKYLNTNTNRNYYQKSKKKYRYDESEETSSYNRADKDILENILKAIQNNDQNREDNEQNEQSVIFIETQPTKFKSLPSKHKIKGRLLAQNLEDLLNGKPQSSSLHNVHIERTNNKNEDWDNDDSDENPDFTLNSRRTGGSDEGSESEMEKNPGNPFTIHKNKYKQNWPYDHFMDGDHMNINPFGPQFQSLGPSGPELFFGRKWWYFNQDDYKPMG